MSIVYAVFRRIKDFISYDRYGQPYHKSYDQRGMNPYKNHGMEPFFHDMQKRGAPNQSVRVIEIHSIT